ncbi:MAG: molybdopterin cofactor-binding domain-containing protein [Terriglobales bacterium]
MAGKDLPPGQAVEPERYEFFAPPPYRFDLGRREFFQSLAAGIVVIGLLAEAPAEVFAQRRRRGEPLPDNIGAWLHIGEDGGVTVYTGKVEVGQGVRTSLAQEVGEELRVDFAAITMVMGDTRLTPYDMGTFGSRTTPTMGQRLRRIAGAARDLLVQLAANQWNAPPERLQTAQGQVSDPATGGTLSYGELAQGKRLAQAVAMADPLRPAAEWTLAGTSVPRAGGRAIVTGAHRYPYDCTRPGMQWGKVARPPAYGAKLLDADIAAARMLAGATVVRDGDFLGVAAPTPEMAESALLELKPTWGPAPPQTSSDQLYEYLLSHPADGDAAGTVADAALEAALAASAHRLAATYHVAYIQHVPLEPRAAVAEWRGGLLTVWTGTQRPFGVRDQLIEAFHLRKDQVRVLMPDTGGAYGGKHTGEAALEAARLARAADKPVKVNWTREEEFTWAYFRPAGVIRVRAGVGAEGRLAAWQFDNYNSGEAGIETPYEAGRKRIQFHPTAMPLRQGSYRCLAATANHFARESAMDELARAAGLDTLEFRLRNLRDDRLAAVFRAAAHAFGWPRAKTRPGQGFGMGGGVEKGGRLATCVEVQVVDGQVRLERIVSAFECGAIVDPDNLKNQVAGGAIMGLGGALFEAIEFADGRILSDRLSRYRVPRLRDVPPIEVVLVDRKDLNPSGAGEAPIMGVAPAIANAIFDASGRRVRHMPLAPHGLET